MNLNQIIRELSLLNQTKQLVNTTLLKEVALFYQQNQIKWQDHYKYYNLYIIKKIINKTKISDKHKTLINNLETGKLATKDGTVQGFSINFAGNHFFAEYKNVKYCLEDYESKDLFDSNKYFYAPFELINLKGVKKRISPSLTATGLTEKILDALYQGYEPIKIKKIRIKSNQDITKFELLAIAKKLIKEKGSKALTIRKLAIEANTTLPKIYELVENKDEILELTKPKPTIIGKIISNFCNCND